MNPSETEILLPDLERQLRMAAARMAEPASRSARSRSRLFPHHRGENPRIGVPRRVAVTALAALAIGGTAAATTGIWHPTIGDYAHDGPPSISEDPVPASIMNSLAVLRREPTARDRGPSVEETLHSISSYHVNEVHPDTVRYLGPGAGGAATILLVAGESELFPHRDAICVYHPITPAPHGEPPSGSPEDCWRVAEIRSGKAVDTIEGPEGEWTSGLVPDRVASITLYYSDKVKKEFAVVNNFYADFRPSPGFAEPVVTRITWHARNGAVIPQSADLYG